MPPPPPVPADTLQPRAVVMGKHDRSRITSFFMGSAAAYATTHCQQPLVVIHDIAPPLVGSPKAVVAAAAAAPEGEGEANPDHEA